MISKIFKKSIFYFLLSGITMILTSCLVFPYPPLGDPVPVEPPDISISDLLLDTASFPPGWQIDSCVPYCSSPPGEASRTFGRIDLAGHIIQDVFYYRTERGAKVKFQRYLETTSLPSPPELSYQSPIADEQYVQCGIVERNGIKVCQAGRRYGNYFIYFYFDIDTGDNDGFPSTKDIEPILQALDELVSERLDIPLPDE